jgi:hypothetical protein
VKAVSSRRLSPLRFLLPDIADETVEIYEPNPFDFSTLPQDDASNRRPEIVGAAGQDKLVHF